MAQGKVTDFFATRKRNAAAHPSKRRKIEIASSEVGNDELNKINRNPYKNVEQEKESVDHKKENSIFSPLQTRAARKAKSLRISTPKPSTRTRKTKTDCSQKLIADVFAQNPKSDISHSDILSGKVQGLVTEAVTSNWDDHDGPDCTPTKAVHNTDETSKVRKRGRHGKSSIKIGDDDVTPEKCRPPKTTTNTESKSRKKLQLKLTSSDDNDTKEKV